MARVWLTFGLLLGAWLCACQPAVPPLVELHDISPNEFEPQDRIAIRGDGFPEGVEARISFDGVVQRSGEAPTTRFSVETSGRSESSSVISLIVSDSLAETLLGPEGEARHTTFRGMVSVAFAPKLPGAPPVVGRKPMTFDVFPGLLERATTPDADQLASFFGAQLTALPRGQGLKVSNLVEDGRLSKAGLVEGDVLTRFGNLNLKKLGDLEPYAGQDLARLFIRRNGRKQPLVKDLPVAGFRPQLAERWKVGLGLLVALAAAILLSRSPLARWVTFLASTGRKPPRNPRSPLQRPPKERLIPEGFGSFLGASGLFAAVGLEAVPWIADFDLLLVGACASGFWLLSRSLAVGTSGNRRSLLGLMLSPIRALISPLIMLLALTAVVLQTGTLSLLKSAQSLMADAASLKLNLPLLFSPGGYLACLSLTGVVVLASLTGAAPSRKKRPLLAAGRRSLTQIYCLLVGGMLIAIFFGGWHVPEWTGKAQSRLLGGLIYQAKFTTLYVLLLLVRHHVKPVLPRYLSSAYWRYLFPGAALSALITPVWLAAAWPPWLKDSVAMGLLMLTVYVAGWIAFRLLRLRHRPMQTVTVNPWL